MQQKILKSALLLCTAIFLTTAFPALSFAENTELEVSGWIPYWAPKTGTKSASKNIKHLSVIYPFAYSVKSDGSLTALANIKKDPWKKLFSTARKKDVLVIPTVMSSNTWLIHSLLSNPESREKHIKEIVSLVKKGKYDGIDIDYEGKSADTHDAFALFLKELKEALGKKILSCTIEARTPPDSLYRTIPTDLRYANDFSAIATHCDRANIMTYDQQRADIKLNDAHKGEPYIPVSDPLWVRKVIELTLKTIPKEKLSLGIPTYGHEYEVIVYSDAYQEYGKTGAFNPSYGIKTAKEYGIIPARGNAGELFISFPTTQHAPQRSFSAPRGTPEAGVAAAQSFAYTAATKLPSVFYYATWSDAEAVRQKVELAREYELLGVALFKIDGNEDKTLWDIFR